jgi:hypothetical protein
LSNNRLELAYVGNCPFGVAALFRPYFIEGQVSTVPYELTRWALHDRTPVGCDEVDLTALEFPEVGPLHRHERHLDLGTVAPLEFRQAASRGVTNMAGRTGEAAAKTPKT